MSRLFLKKLYFRLEKYGALAAPPAVLLFAVAMINPASQLEWDLQTVSYAGSQQLAQSALVYERISPSSPSETPEARSEAFWLSRPLNENGMAPVSWKAPVSVGDHVILNYGGSYKRTLIVLALREVHNPETNTNAPTEMVYEDTSEADYVLTCRDPLEKNTIVIELRIDANGRGLRALRVQDQTL